MLTKKTKAELREAKRQKKMPVSGKSVFKLKKIIEKKAQSKLK